MNNYFIKKLVIPKTEHLDQKYWFVNPGIMTQSQYDKAFIEINSIKLTKFDLSYILFLGVKYLVCYLELFSLDQTPLIIECIENHLKFLLLITSKQENAKYFLHHKYISYTSRIVDHFIRIPNQDYLERQMYLDQIEQICKMLLYKSNLWITDNDLLCAYMFRYGYSPCKTSVLYCSYLIPNQHQYLNPLQHVSQRLLDKIEMKCFCKIKLSIKTLPCQYSNDFILLESLFDSYRGNFLGFLDMLEYIVRCIHPTLFFPHSLRTIILEDSCYFNFLTNIPYKNLIRLGKSIALTGKFEPFLNGFSASKRLYSLLELLIEEKDFKINEMENSLSSSSDEILDICQSLNDSYNDEEDPDKQNEYDVINKNRILNLFNKIYHGKVIEWNKIERNNNIKYESNNELSHNNNSGICLLNNICEEKGNTTDLFDTRKQHSEILIIYENESNSLFDTKSKSITVEIELNECFHQINANNVLDNIMEKQVDLQLYLNELRDEKSFVTVDINHSIEQEIEKIISKKICYYSPFALFNHQLRVMMRCNTIELSEDDLKSKIPGHMTVDKLIHNNKTDFIKKFNSKKYIENQYSYIKKQKGNRERNVLSLDADNKFFTNKHLQKSDSNERQKSNIRLNSKGLGMVDSYEKRIENYNSGRGGSFRRSYSSDKQRFGASNENISEKPYFNRKDLLPHEIIYKRSHDRNEKSWLSDNAEKLLSQIESGDTIQKSYLTQQNDSIVTGLHAKNVQFIFPMSLPKVLTAMDYQTLIETNPNIGKYVKRFGPDTVRRFIDGKLFNESWGKLLNDQTDFDDIIDTTEYSICNPSKILQMFHKNIDEEFNELMTKNMKEFKGIYSLLRVLTKGTFNINHFKVLADGVGIDIPFIQKINQSSGYMPVWLGYLTDRSQYHPESNLSFCICQISYDLILLNIQHSQPIHFIFQKHFLNFKQIINSSPSKILRAFRILQIIGRLEKVQNERITLVDYLNDLINDLLGVHELIYSKHCCKFQNLIHAGIKILYHSINLDNRLQIIEPFMRLPGDRRIKKIEQKGHALITMRGKRHEILKIDEFMLDIFYDFKYGNHFGTIDMLQAMINNNPYTSILQGHRSLICFPTGELWVFNDLNWLKISTTYFVSHNRNFNEIIDIDD